MLALLYLLRENMPAVQAMPVSFHEQLHLVTGKLKLLHPVLGDKELIRLVNVELDKLRRG